MLAYFCELLNYYFWSRSFNEKKSEVINDRIDIKNERKKTRKMNEKRNEVEIMKENWKKKKLLNIRKKKKKILKKKKC